MEASQIIPAFHNDFFLSHTPGPNPPDSFLKDLNSLTTECQSTRDSQRKLINVDGVKAQTHTTKWIGEQRIVNVNPKDAILCPLPKSKVRIKHMQLF